MIHIRPCVVGVGAPFFVIVVGGGDGGGVALRATRSVPGRESTFHTRTAAVSFTSVLSMGAFRVDGAVATSSQLPLEPSAAGPRELDLVLISGIRSV